MIIKINLIRNTEYIKQTSEYGMFKDINYTMQYKWLEYKIWTSILS